MYIIICQIIRKIIPITPWKQVYWGGGENCSKKAFFSRIIFCQLCKIIPSFIIRDKTIVHNRSFIHYFPSVRKEIMNVFMWVFKHIFWIIIGKGCDARWMCKRIASSREFRQLKIISFVKTVIFQSRKRLVRILFGENRNLSSQQSELKKISSPSEMSSVTNIFLSFK